MKKRIKFLRYIKPFVVVKSAQTLDGKIATRYGKSKWITSAKTRAYARRLRSQFDAILVGITTVQKDNPRLTAAGRKRIKKIIIDSKLRISPRARLFRGAKPDGCYLVTTKAANKKKISMFQQRGICVLTAPTKGAQIDLRWAFKKLAEEGIQRILVEGGAHIVGSVLKQGLADQAHIYIAPKIMGDEMALDSAVGLNITDINAAVQLKNIQIRKIGKDIFIKGDVLRNR